MIKNFAIIFCLMILFNASKGQNITPGYYTYIKWADSLYKEHNYKKSARTYTSAFASFGWKGYANDRYNAACAWAMCNVPDSAFFQLDKIVEKGIYTNITRLETDTAFNSLHNDIRWSSLLQTVKQYKDNADTRLFIDSIYKEDQKWRSLLTRISSREVDSISFKDASVKAGVADSLNYIVIKNIFEKNGFIGRDQAGEEGSNHFWLLVLHADKHPEFQEQVLDKMKIEVDKQNASANSYAYLVDRVKVNKGQLQVYGTQVQLNSTNSSFEAMPVSEPDQLNERRKSMQLSSIEDYIKSLNEQYFGSIHK